MDSGDFTSSSSDALSEDEDSGESEGASKIQDNLKELTHNAKPMSTAEALETKLEHLLLVKKEEFKKVLDEGDVIAESLFDLRPSSIPIKKSLELTCNNPIYHRQLRLPLSRTYLLERS